jgi:hypothetical protein
MSRQPTAIQALQSAAFVYLNPPLGTLESENPAPGTSSSRHAYCKC